MSLSWRQCVCGAWYWGSEQSEADKAHSSATPDTTEVTLRKALESVIRLAEPIPHSHDVEQAGMQAEVVIETARAALQPSTPDTTEATYDLIARNLAMAAVGREAEKHRGRRVPLADAIEAIAAVPRTPDTKETTWEGLRRENEQLRTLLRECTEARLSPNATEEGTER